MLFTLVAARFKSAKSRSARVADKWIRPRRTFRPRLESLEDRTLPATIYWTSNASGDWNVPTNWSTGTVPGPSDDVIINQPETLTVTLGDADNISLHSIQTTRSDALALVGGSLTVATTSDIAGSFTLDYGGSTLTANGSITFDSNSEWDQGKIIINQPAQLINSANSILSLPSGSSVYISGTVVNDGMITLDASTNYTSLHFTGDSMLAGTGQMLFTGGGDGTLTYSNVEVDDVAGASPSQLVIGAEQTILSQGSGYLSGATILNGLVEADGSGSYLVLPDGGETCANNGIIEAANGGLIEIFGTLNNAGQIKVDGVKSCLDVENVTTYGSSSGLPMTETGTIDGGTITLTNGSTVYDGNVIENAALSLENTCTISQTSLENPSATGQLMNITIPAGSEVDMIDGTTADFTGTLTAAGIFRVQGGTAVVNGTLADSGNLTIQSGTLNVNGNVSIDGIGSLASSPSATLEVAGNVLGSTTNIAQWSAGGMLQLDGAGSASGPQEFEAMSQDKGPHLSALQNNAAYGAIDLSNNTYVKLVDNSQNAGGPGADAVYVNTLTVPIGSTLDLNNLNLYYPGMQNAQ